MRSMRFPALMLPSVPDVKSLSPLQSLEAQSIHILREAVAEASCPVMLYSMGKDSTVMQIGRASCRERV